ncbi:hypothetical protein IFM89_028016 [Coptis chinensis]|uniref:Zinc knuckle CX2CX4HX4C domain-containing protein n=1 Tax=Coptis chinensis TaxID=261450 RepID=A0A835HKH5_9MAGN|nr:hypothetical protein IFM89_028016 [Coptis chinensis]
MAMGRGLGGPIRVDKNSVKRDNCFCSSVLVDIDLSEPIPDKILVEVVEIGYEFWQEIRLGKMPKFCNHCKIIGHTINECRKVTGHNITSDKGKEKVVEPSLSKSQRRRVRMRAREAENSRDTPSTEAEHGDDVPTLEVIPVQTEENNPGHADQSREPTTQFSNAIVQFDPNESASVQERVMMDLVLANSVPNAMMGVDDSLTNWEEMLYVLDHNRFSALEEELESVLDPSEIYEEETEHFQDEVILNVNSLLSLPPSGVVTRAGTRSEQDKPLQTVNANSLLFPPLSGVVTRAVRETNWAADFLASISQAFYINFASFIPPLDETLNNIVEEDAQGRVYVRIS